MPLLSVEGLCKRFGGLHAVKDVSFGVENNAIKGVIGPNGAGKTTLFNLISGMLRHDAGTVKLDGKEIQGLAPHARARAGIARTFQNIKLFGTMPVLENVMVGRHVRGTAGIMAGMLNGPWTWREEKAIRKRALELLDFLGIADLAHRAAAHLAFGQQRAVELARALALDPLLLLLDEPAAGLNMSETAHLGELIRKIRALDITILLVEHDMSLVMDISDEIVVLSFGQKIAEGKPAEIQRNREVIRVYLGEDDAENQKP
jgi:branched-chain amino acid transport system ATP-binding protein